MSWHPFALAVTIALLVLWMRHLWRVYGHLLAARWGWRRGKAPAEYVAALFDGYATEYDEHLLVQLRYAAASLVSAELNAHLPAAAMPVGRALDLGCGTGLLGVLLRGRVRHLTGVDLSRAMLRAAGARGCYDELHQGSMEHFLRRCGPRRASGEAGDFDLVTAADVLVYCGALDELFRSVARCLAPGGLFLCTTEDLPAGLAPHAGFRLLASGRFAHAPGYVEACASGAGLRCVARRACVLRLQADAPVDGHLYRLVRPRDAASGT
jgi:predicted TPR repeat methyltransferase